MNISLRDIGRRCKEFRVERGYFQTDVAKDTGYSVENISSFETGRNDNARILLWYFAHGMNVDYLFERGVKHGAEI
jgi:transcriptional regulator with XRE-family HTH domain